MKDYSTQPYTTGSFPNVTAQNTSGPGELDGSPFNKQFIDDLWGARQALLDAAGLTPNAQDETATNSQFLEAIYILLSQGQMWLANWDKKSPAGAYSGNLRDAIYAEDLFVICGDTGEIETSPTGSTWTKRTPAGGFTGTFNALGHNGAVFIIVGQNGTIQYSDNAITWTARTAAGGYVGTFYGVAYGTLIWVIVGNTGEIQSSPDGITWTKRTPGGGYSGNFRSVTYGNGLFVAVGSSGGIQTSPDGINWTQRTAAGSYTGEFRDVIWIDELGIFLAVGGSGQIQKSADGITWEFVTALPAELYGVRYAHGSIIVIGDGPFIATTYNLFDSYKTRYAEESTGSSFLGLTYGLDQIVMVGAGAEIEVSLKHQ
jgi:hypothetical protein